MDPASIMAAYALIAQAIALGVKSWAVISALFKDAGMDDATIASLKPKWDLLYGDVRRAAGLDSPD